VIQELTKDQFLNTFVTKKKVKCQTPFVRGSRKVVHRVLKNGWKLPNTFIHKVKRHFPKDTMITIFDPPQEGFGAIVLTYNNGVICIGPDAVHHTHGSSDVKI